MIEGPPTGRRVGGELLLVGALLIMLSGVAGLSLTLQRNERAAAVTRTRLVAEQAAHRLQDFLRSRLLVLEFVRREQLSGAFPDRAAFEALVSNLQHEFGGFHAVNWLDAEGVIRWTCPPGPNQSAEGRSVFDHPVAASVLRRTRETGRPGLTPPLDLFQGGRAFTCYYPVVDDQGVLHGYVNGAFLIGPMVEAALSRGVLDDYDVRLTDGDTVLYGPVDLGGDGTIAGQGRLTLLDHDWDLRLVPQPRQLAAADGDLALAVAVGGVALALAITGALWLVLQRQRQRQWALGERQRIESRLQQAQKMEALGQLAGGVAHDFNNLMTAVLGNVELVLGQGALPDNSRQTLEEVALAARRASALTGQLLAFSRQQVVAPRALDLAVELATLRGMLSRLVRDDVRLDLDLDPRAGAVLLDPTQLGQVLMNLVVNATDAMPDGGRVTIVTRGRERDPSGAEGPHVVLAVRDEGTGMDAETRRRAVEPFFTTKGPGHGTGLGLSTVYGIVAGSDGQLRLHSEPGRGTTVEIWWPACPTPVVAEPSPDARATTSAGDGGSGKGRTRVLVVEDEPAVRKVAVTLLRRAGHEVVEAEDGVIALALAEASRFDVVVTDAVMPRMGGLELAQHLRRLDPQVHLVLCTGYASSSEPTDLEALGAVTVGKPYRAEELLSAVERRTALR